MTSEKIHKKMRAIKNKDKKSDCEIEKKKQKSK